MNPTLVRVQRLETVQGPYARGDKCEPDTGEGAEVGTVQGPYAWGDKCEPDTGEGAEATSVRMYFPIISWLELEKYKCAFA